MTSLLESVGKIFLPHEERIKEFKKKIGLGGF
jgi:hypothetical protein